MIERSFRCQFPPALADALRHEVEGGDLPDKVERLPDAQADTVANPFA
ncbi:hypothetical protein [uncultured Sphingomonas sp.]|nr:hypothetical protein [uncultured Sphingomonas sp.]